MTSRSRFARTPPRTSTAARTTSPGRSAWSPSAYRPRTCPCRSGFSRRRRCGCSRRRTASGRASWTWPRSRSTAGRRRGGTRRRQTWAPRWGDWEPASSRLNPESSPGTRSSSAGAGASRSCSRDWPPRTAPTTISCSWRWCGSCWRRAIRRRTRGRSRRAASSPDWRRCSRRTFAHPSCSTRRSSCGTCSRACAGAKGQRSWLPRRGRDPRVFAPRSPGSSARRSARGTGKRTRSSGTSCSSPRACSRRMAGPGHP